MPSAVEKPQISQAELRGLPGVASAGPTQIFWGASCAALSLRLRRCPEDLRPGFTVRLRQFVSHPILSGGILPFPLLMS